MAARPGLRGSYQFQDLACPNSECDWRFLQEHAVMTHCRLIHGDR